MAPNEKRRPRVFISAAEQSGDQHGAALIRQTLSIRPDVRFIGVAGPAMADAGCERIFDMTRHAAMLLGAARSARPALAMLNTSDRYLRDHPLDAVVVIDSPVLHLPIAKRAHALDIPVLYYIAPQVWAWGARRVYKLRHEVDRVAVILPFEEQYLRDQGVDATFVGHPLAERYAELSVDQSVVDQIRGHGRPIVALLPGSRKHVVQAVLPGQLEVARAVASVMPQASFGVAVANDQVAPTIRELISPGRVSIHEHTGHRDELICAADLALVASGTATLDVAFHRTPMIVMYRASRAFYHLIGRWLIRTRHLSLPNILAGREIVPEFMPYYTSTEPIAERAIELLGSEQARQTMSENLGAIAEALGHRQASQRTAAMLLDMICHSQH